MATTLLVEDDHLIGELVTSGLTDDGHAVRWCRTASEAQRVLTTGDEDLDLCLLDLGLPDGDGLDLCRLARRTRPDALILVLTARREPIDVVAGLDAGADDYVAKPFTLMELQARLRAHRRRLEGRPVPAAPPGADAVVLSCGSLRIDRSERRVTVGGEAAVLREREYELLTLLVESAGQAVRREEILARLWPADAGSPGKSLDVTMTTLRQRIEIAATGAGVLPPVITTLRGYGYRVEPTA